jgi:hypothetical protein
MRKDGVSQVKPEEAANMQANSEHVPNPVPRKQVALGLPPAANSMLDREVESLAQGGKGLSEAFWQVGLRLGDLEHTSCRTRKGSTHACRFKPLTRSRR